MAVGEAVRPHGLRGAVRVHPWLDALADYEAVQEVTLQAEPERRLEVEWIHPGGKGDLVWKFRGVDTPEAAEALRGAVLLAAREVLPGPEAGVYYWEDFEGADAVDEAGRALGRFVDLFGAGGNDVLVLRTPEGGELLVPATREAVVRKEEGRWVLRPPLMDTDAGPAEEGAQGEAGDAV